MEDVSKSIFIANTEFGNFFQIPKERFDVDDYWTPSAGQRNKMLARKGHFIRGAALFDEAFFKMSPREARNADVSLIAGV